MKLWTNLLLAGAIMGGTMSASAKPYAIFHTEKGDITVELFSEKAPKTVENFVGLAKGSKRWQNPSTNEVMEGKPLYSGTVFHRTIPGFMIQGGDPMGNGRGGPGYKFADEFSDLTFDAPGYLAMANSGPNTNGSQFFITVAPTPHLNNKHTIFGKVVSGMDVVDKIVNMPSQPGSGLAANPVKLLSIEIKESLEGGAAKAEKKSDKSTSGSDVKKD
jgi:peptidyl-prolyl cis-trans isomerase A (cyclophilin A)